MMSGFAGRVMVALVGGLMVAATTGSWRMSVELAAMRQELSDVRDTVNRGFAAAETRINRIDARIDDRLQALERTAKR